MDVVKIGIKCVLKAETSGVVNRVLEVWGCAHGRFVPKSDTRWEERVLCTSFLL